MALNIRGTLKLDLLFSNEHKQCRNPTIFLIVLLRYFLRIQRFLTREKIWKKAQNFGHYYFQHWDLQVSWATCCKYVYKKRFSGITVQSYLGTATQQVRIHVLTTSWYSTAIMYNLFSANSHELILLLYMSNKWYCYWKNEFFVNIAFPHIFNFFTS